MTHYITLLKLNTLDDAEYPQKEKYPNGTIRIGYMFEHTKPEVGKRFKVHINKLDWHFITSTVTEIISETEDSIVFKTLNSTYKITWETNEKL